MENRLIKMKESIVANRLSKQVVMAARIFKEGAISGVMRSDTIAVAAGTALMQGTKYKGSVKRAAEGAVQAFVVFGLAGGASNLVGKWEQVKNIR